MTSDSFYRLTPAETYLKLKGYGFRRWEGWEQTRLVAYQVYLSIPKKQNSVAMKIQEFYPLPSDEKNKVKRTNSDMHAVWDKVNKM